MHAREKRMAEAFEHIDKAIAIFPQCAWLYDHKGDLHAALGRDGLFDAQLSYERAIELDPQKAEYHYDLGVILSQRGQLAGAIDRFERALALDANSFDARKALAIVLVASGQHGRAREVIEEGIKQQPERESEYRQVLNAGPLRSEN
jgi:tetratricopeptide (TPR) repeat protein